MNSIETEADYDSDRLWEKPGFTLELENFSGPLDLLLSLIVKRRLDITEVALAQVTEEFLAYLTIHPDLSEASEFLVVAATLLDIKAAQLLPGEETEEEDREYLEARDLLFARLLQYRAFKEVSRKINQYLIDGEECFPRNVPLEPHFAALLPELVQHFNAQDLVKIYAQVLQARAPETVRVDHLHYPRVSLSEQILVIETFLCERPRCSFQDLIADAENGIVIVTRFLAVLELYRRHQVDFQQDHSYAPLQICYREKTDGH